MDVLFNGVVNEVLLSSKQLGPDEPPTVSRLSGDSYGLLRPPLKEKSRAALAENEFAEYAPLEMSGDRSPHEQEFGITGA